MNLRQQNKQVWVNIKKKLLLDEMLANRQYQLANAKIKKAS